MSPSTNLAGIILAPLLGALILGLFGKRLRESVIGFIACTTVGTSALLSFYAFFTHRHALEAGEKVSVYFFTWIRAGSFRAGASLLLDPLIQNVRTFGFHLHRLDVRQHARTHAQAVQALRSGTGPVDPARDVLDTMRKIAELQMAFGPKVFGSFIVSGAARADDILSLVWLAELGGIDLTHIMPVPLFESIDDLRQSATTCASR